MDALQRTILVALGSAILLHGSTGVGDPPTRTRTRPAPKLDADMQAVLDAYEVLGARPIETMTPALARRQPPLADAVEVVQTMKLGEDARPEPVAKVVNLTYGDPPLPLRIYTPKGERPLPVILYFHGGGWVLGDLDEHDATPRALANASGAIVVSAHYRQAPEHRFPAAHDDAFAAYRWVLENAARFGGDPKRIAIAGEGAGGTLAIATTIRARDEKLALPRHMLLVYPIAGADMTTTSYERNANARPLGKAGMAWFVKYVFADPQEFADPRVDLVSRPRADLVGLPSATVITAEIDPLRSEGLKLARKLQAAGSWVEVLDYSGVTHDFFGMGAVVADARRAQLHAGKSLKYALRRLPPSQRLNEPLE